MSQYLTTTTTAKPPTPQTRANADLLARYRNALERTPAGLWSISDQRVPDGADRQALLVRLAELGDAEGQTDPKMIAARVARLFLRFPSSRLSDANAEATMAAYAMDLAPFPIWAIDKAIIAAIEKGGAFAPSSPELRAGAERAMDNIRCEAADIRAVLDAEVYHEQSEDERSKVKAAFETLVDELQLRQPYDGMKRPASQISRPEANSWLERYAAEKPALPKLSDALRSKLSLSDRKEDAA